jgi:hypothetical protein
MSILFFHSGSRFGSEEEEEEEEEENFPFGCTMSMLRALERCQLLLENDIDEL